MLKYLNIEIKKTKIVVQLDLRDTKLDGHWDINS